MAPVWAQVIANTNWGESFYQVAVDMILTKSSHEEGCAFFFVSIYDLNKANLSLGGVTINFMDRESKIPRGEILKSMVVLIKLEMGKGTRKLLYCREPLFQTWRNHSKAICDDMSKPKTG